MPVSFPAPESPFSDLEDTSRSHPCRSRFRSAAPISPSAVAVRPTPAPLGFAAAVRKAALAAAMLATGTLAPGPAAAETRSADPAGAQAGDITDVLLGELYDIGALARIGTYPNGVNGLAAATTSCNNGNVEVRWDAPMAETHPFIGLALFRLKDDVLEQVGRSWVKHGWFALADDACNLGCTGFGGSFLDVGCSDTYSVANNAEPFYLGPREEVNPYTGAWSAWGSFFDAIPVDGQRHYFGVEPNGVSHRMEVRDEDLGNLDSDGSPSRYFYEGVYYVAGDDTTGNNIGWRECSMTWNGSSWTFFTPLGLTPTLGPVVRTWGDHQSTAKVAPDDGEVMLSVRTEDLGAGSWRYHYALYNRDSDRRIRSFSLPVGAASISNPGFRDLDQDAGNDWPATIAAGLVTWTTDDFSTDPEAPALPYQALFNFRIDADAAPVATSALGGIFEPGIGTTFFLATLGPAAAATSAPPGGDRPSTLSLSGAEPNPFLASTTIRFALESPGDVRLSVHDLAGRTVQVLASGRAGAGETRVTWNGRDDAGRRVGSGVYFFRLESPEGVRTVRGTRLR